jgi:PAS domain S-box-containing protein
VHPDDKERVKKALANFLKTGTFSEEYRIVKPDGEVSWMASNAFPVKNEKGEIIRFAGIASDITNQKQSEIAFKEHAQKLNALIGAMPDMYFMMDRQGNYLDVIAADPSVLLAPPEKVIGHSLTEFFEAEEAKRQLGYYERCLNEKKLISFEYQLDLNGVKMFFEARLNPVNDEMLLAVVRDVTQRKQLLEDNRNEYEFREFLFKNDRHGLVILNNHHKVIDVNPRFCKMTGYTADELLTMHTWDFDDIMTEKQVREGFDITQQVDVTFESRHRRKDGSTYEVDVNAVSFYWKAERFVYCSCRDVTEKKAAAKQLEASEKKYRQLVESINDVLFTLDEKGTITYMSPVVTSLTGFDADKYIGAHFNEFVHPGHLDEIGSEFEQLKAGKSYPSEYRINSLTGKDVWVRSHTKAGVNDDGQTEYRGIAQNITESRKAAIELKESEEKYRMLFNANNDSISIFYINDNGSPSNFVEMNETGAKIIGYTKEELLNMNVAQIEEKAPEEVRRMRIEEIMQNGHAAFETTMLHKSGKKLVMEVKAILINYNGKPAILNITRDITARKKSEDVLKESEFKYRNLINNLHAGIVVHNPDSTILYSNPQAASLLGLTQDQLDGKDAYDPEWRFVDEHGDTLKPDEYPVSIVIESKQPVKGKVYGIDRPLTNDRVWVQVNAYPEFTQNDDLLQVVITFIDISAIMDAEKSLRISEEFNSRLLATIPDLVIRTDLEGTIVFLNEPADSGSLFHKKEELIGRNMLSFIHETDLERAVENTKRMFEKPLGIQEYILQLEDGKVLDYEVNGDVVRDGDNNPLGMVYIVRNITKRKLTENALRESELFANAIANNTPALLYLWDIESNQNIWSNNLHKQYFESLSERGSLMTGDEAQEVVHPDDYAALFEKTVELLNNKDTSASQIEIRHKTKEGWKWMNSISSIFKRDENGKATHILGALFDIDDRKKAEEAIKQNEDRFRQVAETNQTVIWELNKEGIYTYVSPMAEKIWGYKPEELINKVSYFDLHPEEGREDFRKKTLQFVEQIGEFKDLLNPIQKADGGIIWVSSNGVPVFNKNGSLKGYIGSDEDVTERLRAEEELRKFKTISDQANYGTAITDLAGKIIYVNEHFARMHGWDSNSLIGENLSILHNEQQLPGVNELLYELKTKGSFSAREVDHVRKNGAKFPTLMNASIVYDEHQQPIFMATTAIDITEIKAVKLELLKLTQAVVQNPIGIVTTDLNGVIEYANPKLCQMTGYVQQELIGQNCRIFNSGHHSAEVFENLWATILDGGIWNGELLNKKKNGELYWESIFISPIRDEQGNIINFAGTKEDVTDKKQLLEDLKIAKKNAESASRLKTAFIDNISHEIRTPLNGIVGFGQLIAQSDITIEERRDYLAFLQQSTDRLIQTVTDFMDISKIASGNMKVHLTDITLEDIFDELHQRFARLCAKKNVSVNLELPIGYSDLMIHSDRELLRKVMAHLLGNAEKFTEEGSISFGYRKEEQSVVFFVKDQGRGIAKDKLEEVFKAFSQEDVEMTRGYEGSGLGLAIVKGIAGLLGGTLKVESEKGAGTEFYLTIPARPLIGSSKQGLSVKTLTGMIDEPLILIVEDNENSYAFMDIVLKKAGIKSLHAKNGLEAVSLCKSYPAINLVFMDIKMPGMDGIEATRLIKQFRSDLPVIAVTAYAKSGEEQIIREAGCEVVFQKPFSRESLLSIVKKYFGKSIQP